MAGTAPLRARIAGGALTEAKLKLYQLTKGRVGASGRTAEPPYGFEAAYQGTPVWEIGRAQLSIVNLVTNGLITRRVLDVSCGTGENAMELSR